MKEFPHTGNLQRFHIFCVFALSRIARTSGQQHLPQISNRYELEISLKFTVQSFYERRRQKILSGRKFWMSYELRRKNFPQTFLKFSLLKTVGIMPNNLNFPFSKSWCQMMKFLNDNWMLSKKKKSFKACICAEWDLNGRKICINKKILSDVVYRLFMSFLLSLLIQTWAKLKRTKRS